ASCMIQEIYAEHVEFTPVPAADDIHGEASTGYAVKGGTLLRHEYRMSRWRIQCREDGAVARALRESTAQDKGIKDIVQTVIRTAIQITFPSRDRHQPFEAGGVRRPGDLHDILDTGHWHLRRECRDNEY